MIHGISFWTYVVGSILSASVVIPVIMMLRGTHKKGDGGE